MLSLNYCLHFIKTIAATSGGDDELVTIRNFVLDDACALDQWLRVTDHLVLKPVDRERIRTLITHEGDYAEVVLKSLQIWNSSDGQVDLLRVLRQHTLNTVASKFKRSFTNKGRDFQFFNFGHR